MYLLFAGAVHSPTMQSSRTIFASYWIFVIVVVATFTGNLTAFLTISKADMPFDSLAEMAEQTEFRYGVQEGVVQHMLLKVGGI